MCVGGCVTMLHECKCDCNGMRGLTSQMQPRMEGEAKVQHSCFCGFSNKLSYTGRKKGEPKLWRHIIAARITFQTRRDRL